MGANRNRTELFAAVHTPMNNDGSINLDVVPQQAALLSDQGVSAVLVAGISGEAASLTVSERQNLVEAWFDMRGTVKQIIVNVGHNCLRSAGQLAGHAARAGADGIAMYAPSFFKPASVQSLIACCAEVASNAPDVPFFYYHMPRLTHFRGDLTKLLESGRNAMANLRGVIYADSRLFGFEQCVNSNDGHFDVFFGVDELLLGAIAYGCNMAIGSSYNFAAPRYREMENAYRTGNMDEASKHSAAVAGLGRALSEAGEIASTKACMSFLGVDCGPVRAPLSNLSVSDLRRLEQRLVALGFL